jgi:dephospho-CoA kinase
VARRFRVGLTGGIGSGKTTVALRFKELGVPVIDADEIAHDLVAPGQSALAEVVAKFGSDVLTGDGQLDRRRLRNQIFDKPELRKELEAILHPLIRQEMERRSAAAQGPYVVMAIPLLVEGGDATRVDRILVVDLDEELQLQRVMARDGVTLVQARAILAAQASRATRLKVADDVLMNQGSIADLRQAVDLLHESYLRHRGAGSPKKPE